MSRIEETDFSQRDYIRIVDVPNDGLNDFIYTELYPSSRMRQYVEGYIATLRNVGVPDNYLPVLDNINKIILRTEDLRIYELDM